MYCKAPRVASTLGSATSRLGFSVALAPVVASRNYDNRRDDFLLVVEAVVTARRFAVVFLILTAKEHLQYLPIRKKGKITTEY